MRGNPLILSALAAALAAACALLAPASAPAATASRAEIVGFALVQDDASLIVRGRTIRLYATFIPDADRRCRLRIRPARCGMTRAAVALDFVIQGFVRCLPMSVNRDDSINAVCYEGATPFQAGRDMGAYLIGEGLAVAAPGAPFGYRTLERIARARGRGVWGFEVDSYGFAHPRGR
jgi:endonuclease YncB( thermonuclease family)